MSTLGPYRVSPVGLGLMSLTWCEPSDFTPDPQAFEVIKTAIDKARPDERVVLNSCTIYGPPSDPFANISLLRRFFTRYPELKDRVVLVVKGGAVTTEYSSKGLAGLGNSATLENLRGEVTELRKHLGSDEGGLPLHFYGIGRRDLSLTVEETITNLHTLQKEGLFEHIALSELGVDSINQAAAAAQKLGTKIGSLELEFSAFCRDIERNGVLTACKKHGISVLAYSPLGKGFLGGKLKDRNEVPKHDLRNHLEGFSDENFAKNVELAATFADLAASSSTHATSAQLALAWLIKKGDADSASIVPIPGTTRPTRVAENMGAQDVVLDDATVQLIAKKTEDMEMRGGRYNAMMRDSGLLFA
ncbi:hypothetical protein OC844_007815 [Tilletia horrida]|nr:hypothetical protein OC844_007815 [Tilletia horrida]